MLSYCLKCRKNAGSKNKKGRNGNGKKMERARSSRVVKYDWWIKL